MERTYAPEQARRPPRAPEPGAEADESYRIVTGVVLSFDVHKDRSRLRLVGRVATTLELACSRCLEPFAMAIDEPFDLRYLPAAENRGEGEREVGEDDLSVSFYRDDEIDLWQLMREQFYLALPMKPLCAETCRGLCLDCGANLNLTTCGCRPHRIDPRLAGLRSILTTKYDA